MPELANAFAFWHKLVEARRKRAEWRALEEESKSLEAQLRKARYESRETRMLNTAQEDELRALKSELSSLKGESREREQQLAQYAHMPDSIDQLRSRLAKAEEEAKEAVQKREEAENDVIKQLDASQARVAPIVFTAFTAC